MFAKIFSFHFFILYLLRCRYKSAYRKSLEGVIPQKLPRNEALSLFVDATLTKEQYNKIRKKDPLRFPSYKEIQLAKKECYPLEEYIIVSETMAEVRLQGLLDHTINRILEAQQDLLQSIDSKLCLISKWGFDGSSQAQYKQKFWTNPEASDANIFIASMVPLRLTMNERILWQNNKCSSTRFCRPIRFQFAHETTELIKTEKEYIDQQIKELKPTKYYMDEANVEITHQLVFTMVDGKICNTLTDTTSTQRCYICGLTSKDFNDIEKAKTAEIKKDSFDFGLSTLHAWIRFFECVLHISYKLPIKKWQARGKENQDIVAETKKKIQARFKQELGLIVDKPKQMSGSTNDGNTSRRFFMNPEKSAEITGVSIDLIKRFKIILQTLASGHTINIEKFKNYTLETAKLYVEKYSWNPMTPTVHKILIHGADVISNFWLPIGLLSEEAQEANNKIFKKVRESYSRKMSREKTNQDVLRRLLINSDPYISSITDKPKRKKVTDKEVLDMILIPTEDIEDETDIDASSESESD